VHPHFGVNVLHRDLVLVVLGAAVGAPRRERLLGGLLHDVVVAPQAWLVCRGQKGRGAKCRSVGALAAARPATALQTARGLARRRRRAAPAASHSHPHEQYCMLLSVRSSSLQQIGQSASPSSDEFMCAADGACTHRAACGPV
jgi:hypothetical protein